MIETKEAEPGKQLLHLVFGGELFSQPSAGIDLRHLVGRKAVLSTS